MEDHIPDPHEHTVRISQDERKEAFLELVRDRATTDSAAAAAMGLSRFTVIRWKKDDPEFLAAYKAARLIGVEHLIAEAERRAMNGSDKMLEFLLCNYAPDKFQRQAKVEHAGTMSLKVVTGIADDIDSLL